MTKWIIAVLLAFGIGMYVSNTCKAQTPQLQSVCATPAQAYEWAQENDVIIESVAERHKKNILNTYNSIPPLDLRLEYEMIGDIFMFRYPDIKTIQLLFFNKESCLVTYMITSVEGYDNIIRGI